MAAAVEPSRFSRIWDWVFNNPTEGNIQNFIDRMQLELDHATEEFEKTITPIRQETSTDDINDPLNNQIADSYNTFMKHYNKASGYAAIITKYISSPTTHLKRNECNVILERFTGVTELMRVFSAHRVRCVFQRAANTRKNYLWSFLKKSTTALIVNPFKTAEILSGNKIAAIGVYALAYFGAKLLSSKYIAITSGVCVIGSNLYIYYGGH